MVKKKKDNLDIIAETIIKESNPVTSENVNELLSGLKGRLYQAMLEGEMNNHLGYSNNDKCDKETDNRRNGYSSKNKKVKTSSGDIYVDMPRDRDGSFNPIIISKRQRIVNDDMNNVIITLYAKGNSQRDIVDIVKQVYNIDVSTAFINDIINEISKEVNKWEEKPLKQFYPFLFVDCLYVNIKKDLVSQKHLFM